MSEGEGSVDLAKDNSVVTVSDDSMKAYINLCPLIAEHEYSVVELKDILAIHKIVYGIDENALRDIVDDKIFYKDVLIAEGVPCTNGVDGYFEFLFNTSTDKKPKILEDGSVDYSSLGVMEIVETGSEIARYHFATKGENGTSVKGLVTYCKNGKELVPLKGKGFVMSEDKQTYTAALSGKVEYSGGKLNVSNLLVIDDDVTHATGNVEFSGDVHIKGAIFTGMTVKAYGHITVDGHVETAQIFAGKDVILKGGMQGAGKGTISAGGNVSGKFFEQTTVQCKENLNANAMLNCDVKVDGEIVISGKLGIIIGGTIYARKGIKATIIGNLKEVKTKLVIGSDKDLVPEIIRADNEIDVLENEIGKIDIGVEHINKLIEKNNSSELIEKKLYLIRAKIAKEAELSRVHAKKEELVVNLDKAVHSKLEIRKSVFPGTIINMSGCIKHIDTENYNVTYQKRGNEIIEIPNV